MTVSGNFGFWCKDHGVMILTEEEYIEHLKCDVATKTEDLDLPNVEDTLPG